MKKGKKMDLSNIDPECKIPPLSEDAQTTILAAENYLELIRADTKRDPQELCRIFLKLSEECLRHKKEIEDECWDAC
jgi:hypothetical protein